MCSRGPMTDLCCWSMPSKNSSILLLSMPSLWGGQRSKPVEGPLFSWLYMRIARTPIPY